MYLGRHPNPEQVEINRQQSGDAMETASLMRQHVLIWDGG